MSWYVIIKLRFISCLVVTYIAGKWKLSCMQPHMPSQVSFKFCCVVTMIANNLCLEWVALRCLGADFNFDLWSDKWPKYDCSPLWIIASVARLGPKVVPWSHGSLLDASFSVWLNASLSSSSGLLFEQIVSCWINRTKTLIKNQISHIISLRQMTRKILSIWMEEILQVTFWHYFHSSWYIM